jgi:putative CocE/NonD family hydrolase
VLGIHAFKLCGFAEDVDGRNKSGRFGKGVGGKHMSSLHGEARVASGMSDRKTHQHRSEVRDGMRIDWDVPITMDDGLVLRADVFRPIAEGRYPVILSYGPYAKGLAFQDGYPSAWQRMAEKHPDVTADSSNLYQSWEVVDPEKWVPHDYACVRVDSRGCGVSPGFIDHFSPRETKDFYDCIEWAGVQPWSNGKVGLNGISYYGINQWHVASREPPHLAAMCIWEGAADWYRDMTHHGGILCTFWENWYDMQVKTVQFGAGERGKRSRVHGELVCGPEILSEAALAKNRSNFGAEIVAHPLDDDYHRARSPVWPKVKVPFLSAANWGGQPLHPRGNFEGFVRAASKNKWLEVHGIEHWTHFYTDYGRELQLRFFDHFLHGKDNGWDKQAPVQLQIRHVDGFVERAEQEWPLKRTQWTKLSRSGGWNAEHEGGEKKVGAEIRGHGRWPHLHDAAARTGDGDHRAVGAQAFCLVLDQGRRHLRGAARVQPRYERGGVPRRHRSACADRPRLAARFAPGARQQIVDPVPALSHPHQEAAAQARPGF